MKMVAQILAVATLAAATAATIAPAVASTKTTVALLSTACLVRDQVASIVAPAVFDDSVAVREEKLSGTSRVEIALDADGKAHALHVLSSSGNGYLDRQALQIAQSMSYAPAVRDCASEGGQYAVDIEFAP